MRQYQQVTCTKLRTLSKGGTECHKDEDNLKLFAGHSEAQGIAQKREWEVVRIQSMRISTIACHPLDITCCCNNYQTYKQQEHTFSGSDHLCKNLHRGFGVGMN